MAEWTSVAIWVGAMTLNGYYTTSTVKIQSAIYGVLLSTLILFSYYFAMTTLNNRLLIAGGKDVHNPVILS